MLGQCYKYEFCYFIRLRTLDESLDKIGYLAIIIMSNSNFHSEYAQMAVEGESKQNGRWTKEQHLKFIEGVKLYGKNWKKIEEVVRTRNGAQIRSHAQKFFNKLFTGSDSNTPQNDKTAQGSLIQNCIINSNQPHLNPPYHLPPEQYGNLVIPPLDPYTLLPVMMSEGQLSHKGLMPHQIWQQSNEILKNDFLQTYVDIQEPLVLQQKQNKHPPMVRKSSFTRCQ